MSAIVRRPNHLGITQNRRKTGQAWHLDAHPANKRAFRRGSRYEVEEEIDWADPATRRRKDIYFSERYSIKIVSQIEDRPFFARLTSPASGPEGGGRIGEGQIIEIIGKQDQQTP
jgi:hypothetical protein